MDKYERIRVVGRGAYGTVYLCNRLSDKKQVIIKQIPVEQMTKDELQASLNEAKVLKMLDHPNVVAYYENFLDDKSIVIVMEYAQGGTLLEFLQQREGKLLEEEPIVDYFGQLVLALQHIHARNILHRDLKSQNILMDKQHKIIKIGDFGISKVLISKSKACTVVGTPCYISPELCEGKPYNQKSDIWALGCVLYELLTLKKPFEADNLPALVGKIMKGSFPPLPTNYSSNLRKLLTSMLETDPTRRPLVNQIMAHPVMLKTIFMLYTTVGIVPCQKKEQKSSPSYNKSGGPETFLGFSTNSNSSSLSPHYETSSNYKMLRYNENILIPNLEEISTKINEIKSITASKSHITLLDKNGSTYYCIESEDNGFKNFVPCFVEDKINIYIVQAVCGDNFTVLLTNRGIVMTFGKGSTGCLGHGDYKDTFQPKIVESLLGMDVVHISCGSRHVMLVTKEEFLFAWGHGGYGKLGLGKNETFLLPQKVTLPSNIIPCQTVCAENATFLITKNCNILATGSNRHNKLAMDNEDGISIDTMKLFGLINSEPLNKLKVKAVATGKTHSAFLTDGGQLYTVGSNKWGQLGWGETGLTHNMPGQVEMTSDDQDTFMKIFCGESFTMAIGHSGFVYVWGKVGESSNLKCVVVGHENSPIKTEFGVTFENQIILLVKENQNRAL